MATEDLAPTAPQIDEQLQAQREQTFTQCKNLKGCADVTGFTWICVASAQQRAEAKLGHCVCETVRAQPMTLHSDLSIEQHQQPDGTWQPGEPLNFTAHPA